MAQLTAPSIMPGFIPGCAGKCITWKPARSDENGRAWLRARYVPLPQRRRGCTWATRWATLLRHRGPLRETSVLPWVSTRSGLPAEQYASQRPALTTEQNISTCIPPARPWGSATTGADRTSDGLQWTQWIFLKLFNGWYNLDTTAQPLKTLWTSSPARQAGIRAAGDEQERHGSRPGSGDVRSQRLLAVPPTAWPTSGTPTLVPVWARCSQR
jgi:hypothetical protein